MSDDVAQSFRLAAYNQIRHASSELNRIHLKGMLEAIIFAASQPSRYPAARMIAEPTMTDA